MRHCYLREIISTGMRTAVQSKMLGMSTTIPRSTSHTIRRKKSTPLINRNQEARPLDIRRDWK